MDFFSFFAWWGGLSPVFRFIMAFLMLGLSALFFFLGLYLWIWMTTGVAGVVMLFTAFPTRGEQKGYHDF